MEYLSQYEYTIMYINGERNTVAVALSLLPDTIDNPPASLSIASIFTIESDPQLIRRVKKGYRHDSWCSNILDDMKRGVIDKKLQITLQHRLLFIGSRLIIPKYKNLREHLFQLAHDNLGPFGADKLYSALREDFYWPNMRKNLLNGYIPSCPECQ
jgi:hypothetical protein